MLKPEENFVRKGEVRSVLTVTKEQLDKIQAKIEQEAAEGKIGSIYYFNPAELDDVS